MRIKVAIDLALDRLFTYSVGRDMEKRLSVGQLLSVPFGHRVARGFAMEISDDDPASEQEYKLKDIISIEDEAPFFSPDLIRLAKAIAAYTASPLESVLKAALPASVLKKNMRPKTLYFVSPVLDAESPDGLTKRQSWLYEQIVRLDGGWLSKLCRELLTTPSSIKTLAKKNLVRIEERQCERNPFSGRNFLRTKPLSLNSCQSAALDAVINQKKPVLLHGITGSGKTEVYLQAIAAELEKGRGAIVMVPEISLTPQTMRRFVQRFGDKVALLHSALSDGERYDQWHRIRRGEALVAVGPRSAVFAPVRNLGLIVVDEEHEPSYKQDEMPRYHARDVAVLRGMIENAKVVLGSATPSLESWMNVKKGKYQLSSMKERAGLGALPSVAIIDMASERGIFSPALLEGITRRLERHEQVILFLNRRGHSTSMVCSVCGATVDCPRCRIPYTYHQKDSCLRCHICGGWAPVPVKCSECSSADFDMRGIGIQKAEAVLRKCFARARILRMDSDTVARKNSCDEILSQFARGEADILIGTQMIAKGLDFPNVTLVGVLNADASLNQPDFRAAERTFQLLSQVAGRAGRAELAGEVVFQTHDASSNVLKLASKGDFDSFAELELKVREEWNFPPFVHLAIVTLSSEEERLASGWAEMFQKSFEAYSRGKEMEVSQASPCAIEMADGKYRWQVVMRAKAAKTLSSAWRWLIKQRVPPKSLKISFDLDPVNCK